MFTGSNKLYFKLKGFGNKEFKQDLEKCITDWERFNDQLPLLERDIQDYERKMCEFFSVAGKPDQLLKYTLSHD